MNPITRFRRRISRIDVIERRIESLQEAVGRVERHMHGAFDFRVYSQFNEDGIIQFILRNAKITKNTFVEIGVGDYSESNTKFLLHNNNWKGLIIDASENDIERVKQDHDYWKYNLTAESHFITAENVNSILFSGWGNKPDLGLFSLDVDGNEYYIWKALDTVSPQIVVIEYQSLFGPDKALTIPYNPMFDRFKSHYSFLYGGASIQALTNLANTKGYCLVDGNSVNLFFVRSDCMGQLKEVSSEKVYQVCQFRNSRDENGNLTFLPFAESQKLIANLPVIDLSNNQYTTIGEAIL